MKAHEKEMKALQEFDEICLYIRLNEDEGYYECRGFKALDTRKLFVMWANETKGLKLRK